MSIMANIKLEDKEFTYSSQKGIKISKQVKKVTSDTIIDDFLNKIDYYKGAVFSSSFEYTGRYSRWDIAFINPPLELVYKDREFSLNALNRRGSVLLEIIYHHLSCLDEKTLKEISINKDKIHGILADKTEILNEEDRTKQTSIFNIIREIKNLFYSENDQFLGLYGAFGYDLIFQFETIDKKKKRLENQNDLVLYFPDEITVIDHTLSVAYNLQYEFNYMNCSTNNLQREGTFKEYTINKNKVSNNYRKGYYADLVNKAIPSFKTGDMFEVVPTQVLYKKCEVTPSQVFKKLKETNPSPYGFIINLGEEFLVGASPEMFVRVEGRTVETCPISGTIKRGADSLEDANNIRTLLNSSKDETELTMCTDVDRNDKSRICVPGSVKVIGRRQIEAYSRLFHTVDHITGELRSEFDALDAFITHMWAVTVTGAPKIEAIKWIEEHEESPRKWYGGAVGWYSFNGNLNTGLTLRTTLIKDSIATLRVGATLLHTSNPEDEEEETLLKISAISDALIPKNHVPSKVENKVDIGIGKNVLIIDHEDSFVHTLASYFKETGAHVRTTRSMYAIDILLAEKFDLVVLSPGPGSPKKFNINQTINTCVENDIPIFGVCLGLQGIIEYFGGNLELLTTPCHGEQSEINVTNQGSLFHGIDEKIKVGRYHSLHARVLPPSLVLDAITDDGVVMAAHHEKLNISGVQFHPESILSSHSNVGLKIIRNVIKSLNKVNA